MDPLIASGPQVQPRGICHTCSKNPSPEWSASPPLDVKFLIPPCSQRSRENAVSLNVRIFGSGGAIVNAIKQQYKAHLSCIPDVRKCAYMKAKGSGARQTVGETLPGKGSENR